MTALLTEKANLATLRYEQIAQELRREIASGTLRPGDRLPPLRVLREQYGVTQATVDKAQGLLEREGLIERIERRGIFVARQGGRARTGLIGFCGLDFQQAGFSPYWARVIAGVEAAALRHEQHVVLLQPGRAAGWDKVDGVIANGQWGTVPAAHAEVPLVSLMVPAQFEAQPHKAGSAVHAGNAVRRSVCCVHGDDETGARLAAEHLLSLGHRCIALLHNGNVDEVVTPRRVAGYHSALKAVGVTPDAAWLRALEPPSPQLYFMHAGRNAMRAWLRAGWAKLSCTALLCHNDETAWGAVESLREAGMAVPGDVSVMGFDGTDAATYCSPGLTTIEVPLQELGERAVELLIQRIEGDTQPIDLSLPVRLRLGASTGPVA